MANINISDLCPAGADLFLDSESYLNDLTEGEMTNTLGGVLPLVYIGIGLYMGYTIWGE